MINTDQQDKRNLFFQLSQYWIVYPYLRIMTLFFLTLLNILKNEFCQIYLEHTSKNPVFFPFLPTGPPNSVCYTPPFSPMRTQAVYVTPPSSILSSQQPCELRESGYLKFAHKLPWQNWWFDPEASRAESDTDHCPMLDRLLCLWLLQRKKLHEVSSPMMSK